jgi:hypothetical protein
MKQRILVAVITALVFGAGLISGVSYERHRPLPPPPGPLMTEFSKGRGPPGGRAMPPSFSRAELFARVEQVRPQIEAYQKRVDAIEAEFEKELSPILTADQRAENERRLKRRAEFRGANESKPLTDEQLIRVMAWPSWSLFRVVSLQVGYDVLNSELKLDDAQAPKVRALLRERRDKYLELMDSMAPPSLELMHLAPYVQRPGRQGPPKKP